MKVLEIKLQYTRWGLHWVGLMQIRYGRRKNLWIWKDSDKNYTKWNTERKKKNLKNSFRELWDNIMQPHKCIIGILEGEENKHTSKNNGLKFCKFDKNNKLTVPKKQKHERTHIKAPHEEQWHKTEKEKILKTVTTKDILCTEDNDNRFFFVRKKIRGRRV